MCRSLRVLCAAPDTDGLAQLRRAAAGSEWELVGGALSLDDLERQAAELEPDVVVMHAGLGPAAVESVRRVRPGARVVALGAVTGADAVASAPEDVRAA